MNKKTSLKFYGKTIEPILTKWFSLLYSRISVNYKKKGRA